MFSEVQKATNSMRWVKVIAKVKNHTNITVTIREQLLICYQNKSIHIFL